MLSLRLKLVVGIICWCVIGGDILSARTLTVASWNVRNYLVMNRNLEGVYRPDYPKPESEKTAVRAMIRIVNPDILLLQEMGGEEFVNELRQDLLSEGCDYPYWAVLKREGQTRAMAVLSREAWVGIRLLDMIDFKYFDEREKVRRGLMEIYFETDGCAWTLFGVHLKSRITNLKVDPDAGIFREREARAVRDYIRKQYPQNEQSRYLIMGDFNDSIDSAPVQRFLKAGDEKLAQEVDLMDTRGERWTYHEAKTRTYQQIDYAIASKGWDSVSAKLRGYIQDENANLPFASDHRMVVVKIEWGEKQR